MHKSICYHTRLDGNNTIKLTGGSFSGSIDSETVNRIVKAFFTVKVKPSGRLVFVDKQEREVSLYLSISPDDTDAGKAAQAEYLKERGQLQKAEEEKERQINDLMGSLSSDEIIRRLTE
jgi:hypothetical protein